MTVAEALVEVQKILSQATNDITNVLSQVSSPPAPTPDVSSLIAEVQDVLAKLQALVPVG